MKHYSTIKKKKEIHTTTWMNVGSIMLSERGQTQKVTHSMTYPDQAKMK